MKNKSYNFLQNIIEKCNKPKNLAAIFQLTLITSIAITLILDCQQIVIFLAKINMAYIGLSFFIRIIKEQTNIFTPPSIAVLTLTLLAANILCFDHFERLYINLAVIMTYLLILFKSRNKEDAQELLWIISFPLGFTALHIMAVSCLCLSEHIWHIWYVTFIVLSIWLLSKRNIAILKNTVPKITLVLLFTYALLLIQIPEKAILVLHPLQIFSYTIDYRYISNTYFISSYYLAIYASLVLIVTIYYFFKASKILKIFLAATALALFYFILITSWRPVWLGLIIGSMFPLISIERRKRFLFIFAMFFLQIGLLTTNVANYGDRVIELARNISTEERIIIWQDAWEMQKASSDANWMYGHGLNNFLIDFQTYSTYRKLYGDLTNYNSPHNILLDILYSSGILGLMLLITFYYFLYTYFIKTVRTDKINKALACAMLTTLTAISVSNGLNHGFFTMINIFPIAFIYGVLIFMRENKIQILKS